jgi:hypothetical protein
MPARSCPTRRHLLPVTIALGLVILSINALDASSVDSTFTPIPSRASPRPNMHLASCTETQTQECIKYLMDCERRFNNSPQSVICQEKAKSCMDLCGGPSRPMR